MTARIHRKTTHSARRWTGGVLVASLWLKIFVLAIGLAQPAQADVSEAASAEQDLLAALHVICTSGGTRITGDGGDETGMPGHSSAAKSGLLDCARCCCSPLQAAPLAIGSCLFVPMAFDVVLPDFVSSPTTQTAQFPVNPRAPPFTILA